MQAMHVIVCQGDWRERGERSGMGERGRIIRIFITAVSRLGGEDTGDDVEFAAGGLLGC